MGSSVMGRAAVRASAQAGEPQHGRISLAAVMGSSVFHRARTLFIVCIL